MSVLLLLWSGLAMSAVPAASITEGTPLFGMAGVVAIGVWQEEEDEQKIFCSGTVIAEGWVLTAAHCLTEAEQYTAQGWTTAVIEGNNLPRDGSTARTSWVEAHPHPDHTTPGDDADLALLRLSRPVGEVIPLLAETTPISQDWVGRGLFFVGFGATGAAYDDAGVKRITTVPIVDLQAATLQAWDPQTGLCFADLGGAALIEDDDGVMRLVGVPVALYTPEDGRSSDLCLGSGSRSIRLDQQRAWIRSLVEDDPGSPQDSATPADEDTATSGDTGDDPDRADTAADGHDRDDSKGAGAGGCAAAGVPLGLGLMLLGTGRRRRRSPQPTAAAA